VRENTPKIATVMKISAIVTGLLTDVLYKLIFYLFYDINFNVVFKSCLS
jgi:hypothetical protein